MPITGVKSHTEIVSIVHSHTYTTSRKLLEDLMKVVRADLGKMKAILDVVEQFSPRILRIVQRINGRLLFTDYMYAVSIDRAPNEKIEGAPISNLLY